LTTKIHAIVDALGSPLAIRLTGGQVHDITQAEALLAEVEPQAIIADKGYDADGFIGALIVRRIKPARPRPTARSAANATSPSTPNAISSSVSSMLSNNSEASQRAMKKPPATSSPESISLAHSLGSNEDTA